LEKRTQLIHAGPMSVSYPVLSWTNMIRSGMPDDATADRDLSHPSGVRDASDVKDGEVPSLFAFIQLGLFRFGCFRR
jgi:hypothetical protein